MEFLMDRKCHPPPTQETTSVEERSVEFGETKVEESVEEVGWVGGEPQKNSIGFSMGGSYNLPPIYHL